ncbi:MAG TPA: SRPBCC domain-containing protein [Stellaceae bacterium]|nr:SRPBCC domain-containing protein [Stellaceae bacterium]
MSEAKTSDRELRVERLIAAAPERVFQYFTDPKLFATWWGPEGMTATAHVLDARVGGAWRTTMRSAAGKSMTVGGIYRVVEAPRRLVFTWAWEDEKGAGGFETEVTVTFAAAPGGTKLTILQREFETVESRDRHGRGWNSTLDKLNRTLA